MLGTELVLNSNPAGAFRMSVPPPMSPLEPPGSVIAIEPRLVQAGAAAFAAVSAEMLPPPLATVTLTAASALLERVNETARTTGRRNIEMMGIFTGSFLSSLSRLRRRRPVLIQERALRHSQLHSFILGQGLGDGQ